MTQPSFLFPHSSWSSFLQLVPHPGMYGAGVAMAITASIAWAAITTAMAYPQV